MDHYDVTRGWALGVRNAFNSCSTGQSLNAIKYKRAMLTTGRIIPRDQEPGYPALEKIFQRGRIMTMPPTSKNSSSGKPK
jgi:hypothetical protein